MLVSNLLKLRMTSASFVLALQACTGQAWNFFLLSLGNLPDNLNRKKIIINKLMKDKRKISTETEEKPRIIRGFFADF